nr:hypothetical protein [Mammaliicoccus sp. Marseille-Q6498]
MKLRILCLLSICFLGVFVLTGCGGAEGKLKGKTFSLEVNGQIPGQITFKENGVLDIKDTGLGKTGSASYEIVKEDGKEYVLISNRPKGENILGQTSGWDNKDGVSIYCWRFNDEKMELESIMWKKSEDLSITDFKDKKPELSKLNEVDKEYTMRLIEEK